MKNLKKKVLKYVLLLIGIFVLNLLSTAFLPRLIDLTSFGSLDKAYQLAMIVPTHIVSILFGLILYFDCRREIRNYYVIPVLGALFPLAGTMFYFIESFLPNQNLSHD
jgi:hypothetical protein